MSKEGSKPFDPYHRWLGISAKDRPPNHYRLLGIDEFENDEDVIESAADRQMRHVRSFQSGRNGQLSQQILNELSAAKICLLNPPKKADYDRKLHAENAGKLAREKASAAPAMISNPTVAPQTPPSPTPSTPAPSFPARPSVASPAPVAQAGLKPAILTRPAGHVRRPATRSNHAPKGLLIAGIVAGVLAVVIVSAIGIIFVAMNSGEQVAEKTSEPKQIEQVEKNETDRVKSEAKLPDRNDQSKGTSHKDDVETIKSDNDSKKSEHAADTRPRVQNEFVGANLDVARMKANPFEKSEQLPNSPANAFHFDFESKPKTEIKNGLLEFSVKEGGLVYLVTRSGYQGNSGGGWTKERVTKQQLVQRGWKDLGTCPWNAKESLLRRKVNAGDTFRIRMNKYWPPSLIVPGPVTGEPQSADNKSTTPTTDVSTQNGVRSGTHFLRLGDEGGIELADTKGIFRPDRSATIEFWARLDPDAKAMILVGDRVIGGKYPEIDNQQGGLMVNCVRTASNQFRADIMFRSGGGGRRFEIAPNEWTHFALSTDTEQVRFFVNGDLIAERPVKPDDWTPGPLNMHLGFHRFLFFSVRHGFNGDLRDVRLSSSCRYREAFSPPEKFSVDNDTQILLKFAESENDRIEDISGNNRHAIIHGGQWIPVDN